METLFQHHQLSFRPISENRILLGDVY